MTGLAAMCVFHGLAAASDENGRSRRLWYDPHHGDWSVVFSGDRTLVKIALVSPYNFRHPGGVAEHILQLRRQFLNLGHEVKVLSPRSSHGGGIEVKDGFYGIGRAVSIPAGGSRARLTFDVTLYAHVKDIMRREQFDVVHLHEPLMPVLPYMVLLNSNAVNVATFHAYRSVNHWYTVFKPYMSFVLGRLDGRITVSEPAREFVRQYFDGPYDVIPNGIDIEQFGSHVEPMPWAGDGVPRILFIGRFDEPRKGFKYLLRALPLIRQQFPRTRLLVVGTGKPEKFENIHRKYGISGVDYIGYVDNDTKARYLASCDVVCFPSTRNESFGLVLTEAMASGKPLVATTIPGYASVVTNEHDGLLVPPEDPAGLALAICRLFADANLRARLSENGRETAKRYAWPNIAAQVLEVYQRSAELAATAPWRQSRR